MIYRIRQARITLYAQEYSNVQPGTMKNYTRLGKQFCKHGHNKSHCGGLESSVPQHLRGSAGPNWQRSMMITPILNMSWFLVYPIVGYRMTKNRTSHSTIRRHRVELQVERTNGVQPVCKVVHRVKGCLCVFRDALLLG